MRTTSYFGLKFRRTDSTSTSNRSTFVPLKTLSPYPFMPARTSETRMCRAGSNSAGVGDAADDLAVGSDFAALSEAAVGCAAGLPAGASLSGLPGASARAAGPETIPSHPADRNTTTPAAATRISRKPRLPMSTSYDSCRSGGLPGNLPWPLAQSPQCSQCCPRRDGLVHLNRMLSLVKPGCKVGAGGLILGRDVGILTFTRLRAGV